MKPDLMVKDIYNNALVNPTISKKGLNRLLIVSGYASSAMGSHHLEDLKEKTSFPKVELLCGMIQVDGIDKSNHQGFISLGNNAFPEKFSCSYLISGEPVHAKIYIWCKDETPVLAFTGSANYTQMALLKSLRREVLTECNPLSAYKYFKKLKTDSVDCASSRIPARLITLRSRARLDSGFIGSSNLPHVKISRKRGMPTEIVSDIKSQFFGLERATLSLVDVENKVPERSGLNWGQRPGRNKDQAYLPVNGELRKVNFFPEKDIHFTVLTDDNTIIQCVRAQPGKKGVTLGAKAIETPHDNSELGRYMRQRLKVPSGELVTVDDLNNYGRSTVDFYKIDDEHFYMDFETKKQRT